MPERIYLIRHGETDWNAERRWQGIEPTDLNDAGRRQAHALARYLHHRQIGAIYSSDLPRALETARILGAAVDVTPVVDVRWREINVGVFQGLTGEEVELRYPEAIAAWRVDDLDYRIPQGESRRDLMTRAYAAWQDMLANNSAGREVAVVSHGGTIRLLLRRLLGDRVYDGRGALPNTSITTLAGSDHAGWRLEGVGEIPHLAPECDM